MKNVVEAGVQALLPLEENGTEKETLSERLLRLFFPSIGEKINGDN